MRYRCWAEGREMSAKEELQECCEGIMGDIFVMESNSFIVKEISDNAMVLDSRENGNFGVFFRRIQRSAWTEVALASSRVFDRHDDRHPTNCMGRALHILEYKASELPLTGNRHKAIDIVKEMLPLANADIVRELEAGGLTLQSCWPAIAEIR